MGGEGAGHSPSAAGPPETLAALGDEAADSSAARPRVVVIAGTASGAGKTALTLGLIAALRAAGHEVATFKIGPDFQDPGLHAVATGRRSASLDAWMLSRDQNLAQLYRHTAGADIAVVEGAMGLFDGRDGVSEDGSTAQMAKWLGAPVVLVMDCMGLGRSAAAMLQGYAGFDKDLTIGGVILNRIGGPDQLHWLKAAFEASEVRVPVLGGIPMDDHLALVDTSILRPTSPELAGCLSRAAALVEESIDLQAILSTASRAPPLPTHISVPTTPASSTRIKLGVAYDQAFCSYYATNLSLLQSAGAELVMFSPLIDPLPLGLSAIYLGGGRPEAHAAELARNQACLAGIRAFAASGGLIYAECGGLMYLSTSIQPVGCRQYPTVGVFPFRCEMTRRVKMGYVEVETQGSCQFFPARLKARGHFFHFYEVRQEGEGASQSIGDLSGQDSAAAPLPDRAEPSASSPQGFDTSYLVRVPQRGHTRAVPEGFTTGNVLGSNIHLHWGSEPRLASALVEAAAKVNVHAANSAVQKAVDQILATISTRQSHERNDAGASVKAAGEHAEGDAYSVDERLALAAALTLRLRDRERSGGGLSSDDTTPVAHVPWTRADERAGGIACLAPAATEIVFALGLQGRLLGVSDLCDFPAEAANYPVAARSKAEASGSPFREAHRRIFHSQLSGQTHLVPDEEFLRRESPSLILSVAKESSLAPSYGSSTIIAEGSRGSSDGRGPTTLVLHPHDVSGVIETITQVAALTSTREAAKALTDVLRGRLRHVVAKVTRSTRSRPSVLTLESWSPLVLSGRWMPDMQCLAGGFNPIQEPGDPTKEVSWAELRKLAPEVLILSGRDMSLQRALTEVSSLAERPGWWNLPAVRNGEVYICQHAFLLRPGPRLVDGIETLARILHPESVEERIPEGRVLKLILSGGRRCRPSLLPNYFQPFV